eukprot:CAMPEP_0182911634 /NCGR_PEP_ID=MMETSP0034_2-20130328/37052_1 /TAXON_ID=156128 /ORGANISM="Nephroselmis pyriformis, Strain CCMP717" /LENGTH=52 /DNA_ID=CAMNT_0025048203 /DNA_START=35 /DNA_END=193 /DNA_ORIENTATION=-
MTAMEEDKPVVPVATEKKEGAMALRCDSLSAKGGVAGAMESKLSPPPPAYPV